MLGLTKVTGLKNLLMDRYLNDNLILDTFTKEASLLCSLLKKKTQGVEGIDWKLFMAEAAYHEILETLYKYIEENSFYKEIIPEYIMNELEKVFYSTWIKNEKLWNEFKILNNKFRSAGIEFIPLKGIILDRFLYREPGTRRMVDIDVLVKKKDIFKINELLLKDGHYPKLPGGLKQALKQDDCFLEFAMSGKRSDIRFGLDLQWTDEVNIKNPNKIALNDAFRRKIKIKIEDVELFILSTEDTFFNLCLHKRRFGKTVILKYLLDIALLIKRNHNHMDWDFVIKESRQNGLGSLVFTTLYLSKLLFDVPFPEAIIENFMPSPIKIKLLAYFCKNRMFSRNRSLLTIESVGITYLLFLILTYDRFSEVIRYVAQVKKISKFYRLKYPSLKTGMLL